MQLVLELISSGSAFGWHLKTPLVFSCKLQRSQKRTVSRWCHLPQRLSLKSPADEHQIERKCGAEGIASAGLRLQMTESQKRTVLFRLANVEVADDDADPCEKEGRTRARGSRIADV